MRRLRALELFTVQNLLAGSKSNQCKMTSRRQYIPVCTRTRSCQRCLYNQHFQRSRQYPGCIRPHLQHTVCYTRSKYKVGRQETSGFKHCTAGVANLFHAPIFFTLNSDAPHKHSLPLSPLKRVVIWTHFEFIITYFYLKNIRFILYNKHINNHYQIYLIIMMTHVAVVEEKILHNTF